MDIYCTLNYTIWGTIGLSTIMTIFAAARKSISLLVISALPLLLMYAFFGYIYGFKGILVAGFLGLLITCLQIALIINYSIKTTPLERVLLIIAAVMIWISIWSYVGNPFGLK